MDSLNFVIPVRDLSKPMPRVFVINECLEHEVVIILFDEAYRALQNVYRMKPSDISQDWKIEIEETWIPSILAAAPFSRTDVGRGAGPAPNLKPSIRKSSLLVLGRSHT